MSFDLVYFSDKIPSSFSRSIGRRIIESCGGMEVDLFYLEISTMHLHFDFGFLFPMLYPQLRNVLTTLGVIAAVSGTLMKMKDL